MRSDVWNLELVLRSYQIAGKTDLNAWRMIRQIEFDFGCETSLNKGDLEKQFSASFADSILIALVSQQLTP
jgi:hypothetical protein